MVSVLLLSFNHAKFIEQSLRSIIDQTYKEIEIIYLDNASADDSFIIAESILKQSGIKYKCYKRDRIYKTAENFNFLMQQSNNSHLCLLSADDWLDKRNIEEKMKAMDADPSLAFVDSNGFKYYNEINIFEPVKVCYKRDDLLQSILEKNFVSGIGCIVKKEILEKIGGWDESLLIEDWDLWIRIIEKYPVGCCDEKLFYYRQHINGLSNNIDLLNRARMETYYKYKHLNKQKSKTLKNIKETYLSKAVMTKPAAGVIWNVLKDFKLNKLYVILLIKALLPVTLKKKHYIYSLKKRNKLNPTN